MADAGELKAVVSAETSDFLSKMNELAEKVGETSDSVQERFDKMGESVEGINSILAKFGLGAGLAEIADGALEAATALGKLETAFDNLEGATEANLENFEAIKDLQLTSMFNFAETLGPAAQRMEALGMTTEQAKDAMTALVDEATALKQGPEWINSAVDALARVDTQAQVTARSMMQLTRDGIQAWPALAEAMDTSISGAMDAVKNHLVTGQQVVDAVTQYMTEKYGDAAANIQSSWKLAWHDVGIDAEEFQVALGQSIGSLLQTLTPLIEDLGKAIQDLTEWWKGLSPPMQDAILAFGAFLTIISALAGAAALLAPLITTSAAVAVGIAALLAGLVAFGVWVNEHWEPIVTTVQEAWKDLLGVWQQTWGAVVAWFEGIIAGIEAAFEPFAIYVNAMKLIFNGLLDAWGAVWNGVKTLLEFVWNTLKQEAEEFWSVIQAVIGGFIGLLEKIPGLSAAVKDVAATWNDANAKLEANKQAAADAAAAQKALTSEATASSKAATDAALAQAQADQVASAAAKAASAAAKQAEADAKAAQAEEKAVIDGLNKAYQELLAVSPELAASFKDQFDVTDKSGAALSDTFTKLEQHGVAISDSFKASALQAAATAQAWKDLGATSETSLAGAAETADAAFDKLTTGMNAIPENSPAYIAALDGIYKKHQALADYLNSDVKKAFTDGTLTADQYYQTLADRATASVAAAQTAMESGTGTAEAYFAAQKTYSDAMVAQVDNNTAELATAYHSLGVSSTNDLEVMAGNMQKYADKVQAAEGGDTITTMQAHLAALVAQKNALDALGQPLGDVKTEIDLLTKAINEHKASIDTVNDAYKTLGLTSLQDATDKTNQYAKSVALLTQAEKDYKDGLTTVVTTQTDVWNSEQKLLEQTQKYIDQLNGPMAQAYKDGKITSQDFWQSEITAAQNYLTQLQTTSTGSATDLANIQAAELALKNYTEKDLADAFKTLHTTSTTELTNLQTDAQQAFTTIATSGVASPTQIQQAWVNSTKQIYDCIVLGSGTGTNGITNAMANEYSKQQTALTQHLTWTVSQWQTTYDGVHKAISGAFDDVVKDLVTDPKSFQNTMIKLGQDLATAMIDGFIAPFKKAITDLISNELSNLVSKLSGIGDQMTNLFKPSSGGGISIPGLGGGGAASVGSGEAGAEGSAIGGDLGTAGDFGGEVGSAGSSVSTSASSISGTLGSFASSFSLVTGAVSAISGVANFIQGMHTQDIEKSIELNTRLTAMFIGGLGDGGVQTWTNLTAQYTSKLMDLDSWIHDSWVELLDDMGTLIGQTGGGGWLHDYLANGLGPQIDQLVAGVNSLAGIIQEVSSGPGAAEGAAKTPGGAGPAGADTATNLAARQTLGGSINDILAAQAQIAAEQAKASQAARAENTTNITVNAGTLTTKDAAVTLGNQIARNLSDQMVASSMR